MNRTHHLEYKRTAEYGLILALLLALLSFSGCTSAPPKETVTAALKQTFQFEHPFTELLGTDELLTAFRTGDSFGTDLNLTLQRAEFTNPAYRNVSKAEGAGLRLNSVLSPKTNTFSALLGINYTGVISLDTYLGLSGNNLTLRIPKLLSASFTTDLSTIGADLNGSSTMAGILNSALSSYGRYLPSSMSIQPWSVLSPNNTDQPAAGLAALKNSASQKLATSYDSFLEQLTYTKLKRKDSRIPNDPNAKAYYCITVPAEAYQQFLTVCVDLFYDEWLPLYPEKIKFLNETLGTDFSTSELPVTKAELKRYLTMLPDLCDDPEIIVGLTKSGRVVYAGLDLNILEHIFSLRLTVRNINAGQRKLHLSYEDEFKNAAEFELLITSDAEVYEYEAQLKAAFRDTKFTLLSTLEYERASKEFTFGTTYSTAGKVLFGVSAEGQFTEIQKGVSHRTVFHYLDVDYADSFSISLSGSVALQTNPQPIDVAAEKTYKLFKLGKLDLLVLGTQLTTNVKKDPVLSKLYDTILDNPK